jgi:EmrB/QacA subfamily drug resistance transporter
MLDSSVVNVAVEPIARELHAGLGVVQWTVSGYLLALGIGLAGTAYLSRRFGTLSVYRVSIATFTLASVACALAPDLPALLAARVVQGLVAAPLVPMAMSMLLGNNRSARSIPATAGMLLFLGPALGPSVGGALIAVAGWRAIFLINLPTGLGAVVAVRRLPPSMGSGPVDGSSRLDVTGLLLLAAGLGLLLLGITLGGTAGWAAFRSWLPLAAGGVLLSCYAVWARRTAQPVLDIALARSRGAFLALTICALASVVTFSVVFLLPVFVQYAQGHSPLVTGIALLPQGIVTGLSTTLGQRALRLVSVRVAVMAGFGLLTAASASLVAVGAHTPLAVIAVLLAARSASIGLVIAPLLAVLTGPLRQAEIGDASTLFSIWQRVAGSLGVGLIAAIFTRQAAAAGPVAALHLTAVVLAAVAAAGLVAAAVLPAGRVEPLVA